MALLTNGFGDHWSILSSGVLEGHCMAKSKGFRCSSSEEIEQALGRSISVGPKRWYAQNRCLEYSLMNIKIVTCVSVISGIL